MVRPILTSPTWKSRSRGPATFWGWAHTPALDETLAPDLRACLTIGNVDGFGRRLENFVFKIAHENLQQEAGYRALLQALFLLMAVPTQSEKSNWGERADHEVQIDNRVYVFKVKYNETADTALRQIQDRGYGREHLGSDRTVTAVGLAFRRDLKTGPCLQVAQADLAVLLEAREAVEDDGLRNPRHRTCCFSWTLYKAIPTARLGGRPRRRDAVAIPGFGCFQPV